MPTDENEAPKKKAWVRPQVQKISLEEVRDRIMAAIGLIESDPDLTDVASDLKRALGMIEEELGQGER
ncbi:hypothetical protein ABDK56_12100 [Sphingomonas sp. ASV193]|uniref:hypothetical protein n=1 Tax=Sphingomonas sp. ASV193 TaxID=3144405 RepID=UPI0032E8B421